MDITDFHSHILPGMDDGSPDISTSVQMLKLLKAQGVSRVCLTSHYYAWDEDIDVFSERRQKAFELLASEVNDITLIPGAEVAFFPEIERCEQLDKLCLQGTKTLLLEMPFTDWTQHQKEQVLSMRIDRGYDVVLVHPERFLYSKGNERILEQFAEFSVPFQVNAATLTHWRTRRTGLRLLEMTQYPLLGTDCHNLTYRKPCMDEARKIVKRKLGEEFLQEIDETAEELLCEV